MTKEERKKKKKEAKLLAKKALLDGGRPSFMISRSHPKLKLKVRAVQDNSYLLTGGHISITEPCVLCAIGCEGSHRISAHGDTNTALDNGQEQVQHS